MANGQSALLFTSIVFVFHIYCIWPSSYTTAVWFIQLVERVLLPRTGILQYLAANSWTLDNNFPTLSALLFTSIVFDHLHTPPQPHHNQDLVFVNIGFVFKYLSCSFLVVLGWNDENNYLSLEWSFIRNDLKWSFIWNDLCDDCNLAFLKKSVPSLRNQIRWRAIKWI